MEPGRYYELHADIPREGDEPFHNYTSLAILPKAAAKQYKPEEIPFTSRSWDNRIGECFYLSDRLGVRICGIWGGWSADPPYEPYAPTIELCEKLGMGVLTGAARPPSSTTMPAGRSTTRRPCGRACGTGSPSTARSAR